VIENVSTKLPVQDGSEIMQAQPSAQQETRAMKRYATISRLRRLQSNRDRHQPMTGCRDSQHTKRDEFHEIDDIAGLARTISKVPTATMPAAQRSGERAAAELFQLDLKGISCMMKRILYPKSGVVTSASRQHKKGKTGWVPVFLMNVGASCMNASRNYFACAPLTLLCFTLYVK